MYNLVIFGSPGAGKGTQSDKIIAKFGFKHISTGDMFRDHLTNKTELGSEAQKYMNQGELVPDSITIKMLEEEISSLSNIEGLILDGFPRTLVQANALDNFFESMGQKVNLVIQLDVSEEVIKQRIKQRRLINGRVDDAEDKLIKRIDEYYKKTINVLPYYQNKGILVKINGVGQIDDIYNEISKAINNSINKNSI